MTIVDKKIAKNRIAGAKERIVPLYKDGMTINQIAKTLNLTRETVQAAVRAHNKGE